MRNQKWRGRVALLLCLAATGTAHSQCLSWTQPIQARLNAGFVYDSLRQQLVITGSWSPDGGELGDVWALQGGRFVQLNNAAPEASSPVLFFDQQRGTSILFGGLSGVYAPTLRDTWEWDGAGWRKLPVTAPPARYLSTAAYDRGRHIGVMFGGHVAETGSELGDTWIWSNGDWSQSSDAGPSARMQSAMAYDSQHHVCVLFGGNLSNGETYGDTWLFDGSSWQEVDAPGPVPRYSHKMAYDETRGRVVLFGGRHFSTSLADTWEWDGASWTRVATGAPSPGARTSHAMAFDPQLGGVVMTGGNLGVGGQTTDAWLWNGVAWTQLVTDVRPSVSEGSLAYDPNHGRALMFGGVSGSDYPSTLWSWDGGWSVLAQGGPPGRSGAALAYDPERDRLVMFGGQFWSDYRGDTWEWDGTAWQQFVVPGPSPRVSAAMAYDTHRHRMVLCGGYSGSLNMETWEWDGAAWTDLTDSNGNDGGMLPYVAYDDQRGVMVLSSAYANDRRTWERVDTSWFLRTSSGPDSCRAMTYDPSRGRVVACNWSGTCEWTGTAWSVITPSGVGAYPNGMFYDLARHRLTDPMCAPSEYITPDPWTLDPMQPPTITMQPVGAVACASHAAVFRVAASGPLLTYQWLRNGTPLSGQMGPTLVIEHPTLNLGLYSCVVSNGCGPVSSAQARLVRANDFDGDGNVSTDADIDAFFRCISGNCCPSCGGADFDGDGSPGTDADIAAFFRSLAGFGC
jgi:hypothetical protein